ncbi:hypothetical protein DFH09DRAFT_228634 [Mycena vulgaris]|nr:hypothetical protein DFH09DRAFT_228634 [Mycena vulgaris]
MVTWSIQGGQHGLKRAAHGAEHQGVRRHVEFFLRVLAGNLIYYRVVFQLASGLTEVSERFGADIFHESCLAQWDQFFALAAPRVAFLEPFSSEDSSQACDNRPCGVIRHKSHFQRCSGCKAFYYCSATCQINDWQRGGHRAVCSEYGTLSLTSQVKSTLSARSRTFLRAILHTDYTENRPFICEQQVAFMAARPNVPFFTLFDYTAGAAVKIDVHAIAEFPVSVSMAGAGAEWRDLCRRVAQSAGRMQLHVMGVAEGTEKRWWVVPLRTSSARIHDRLREVAASVAKLEALNLTEEIDVLLRDGGEVMEIH